MPASFAEFPARIRDRLSDVLATQDAWLLTEGQLDVLQRRVKLRGSGHQEVQAAGVANELAHALLALLPATSAGDMEKHFQKIGEEQL